MIRDIYTTLRTPRENFAELGLTRWSAFDMYCSPRWTWEYRNVRLRHWWRHWRSRHQRRGEELERNAASEAWFAGLLEQERIEDQFWLIVDDPNY